MKEYVPGERCRLTKREGYWRMGEDGNPLPYLDEIVFVQLGDDPAAWQTALKSGQVEMIVEPPVTVWEGVKDDPTFTIISTPTAATRTLRVRVDQDPWKDNKVRQALKHCHNREKILALALRDQGVIGNDSHVAPAQGEYVPLEPFPFDTAKSMALLKEAGVTTPVKVEINVASDWPESMAYAQALKEDAVAGGFDITLKTDARRTSTGMAGPISTPASPGGRTARWQRCCCRRRTPRTRTGSPCRGTRPAGSTMSSRSCSPRPRARWTSTSARRSSPSWRKSRRSAAPSARRSL